MNVNCEKNFGQPTLLRPRGNEFFEDFHKKGFFTREKFYFVSKGIFHKKGFFTKKDFSLKNDIF